MSKLSNVKQLYASIQSLKWLNRYTTSLLFFLVWVLFFDKHNARTQWELHHSVENIKQEIVNYKEMAVAARLEKSDIELNKEKYARERFYMHKENEDVFIIVNEE